MGVRLRALLIAAPAAAALVAAALAARAEEPKHGGILKIYHRETPGGISIHEEATYSTNAPMMAMTPPRTQTVNVSWTLRTRSATSAGFRKIPDPMMPPTTIIVAEKNPSRGA